MKLQYSDPEAHERWCEEADYRRDEIRDNLWEEQQNKKTMNETPITKEELSDREMLRLLSSRKTADEIRTLIKFSYDICKADHERQEAIMENIGFDHDDYRVEKYMSGFYKGRCDILENIYTRIQWNWQSP